ncbi:hypothetical protein SAMN05216466_102332 [Paraburkholderia phenazinium]|jgi:hypothetical protein|uniref:Uncharacterized protein n=1 Tax=Paraburkholderia phenazinium TaxID=60549 RepID=A0A1G7S2N1_9BURK|nr:hypothetical protein SAMN05216466_102332 [Paraburkholderia phenazinium]
MSAATQQTRNVEDASAGARYDVDVLVIGGGPAGTLEDLFHVITTLAAHESNVAHALRIHFDLTELMLLAPRSTFNDIPAPAIGFLKLPVAYRCADLFVARCQSTDENRSTLHLLDCRLS